MIANRFRKAADSYGQHAIAQHKIATNLVSFLKNIHQKPASSILEVGCGSGFLTTLLADLYNPAQYVANDLSINTALNKVPLPLQYVEGDAEKVLFGIDFDLIASSSTIQWFCDLPRFFKKTAQSLKNEGIFAFSSFLPGNLEEIFDLTRRGLKYNSETELKNWLSEYFEILHFSQEEIILHFDHPTDVLRHLKETGVTGTGNFKWTRGTLQRFNEHYLEKYGDQNGVTLTYRPVYVIAKKK